MIGNKLIELGFAQCLYDIIHVASTVSTHSITQRQRPPIMSPLLAPFRLVVSFLFFFFFFLSWRGTRAFSPSRRSCRLEEYCRQCPQRRRRQSLFRTTARQASTPDNNNNNNEEEEEEAFLSSLRSRVQQVQQDETKIPIIVLDSILPRQVLQLQIMDPTLLALVQQIVQQEKSGLGMVGTATLLAGKSGKQQTLPLQNGVWTEFVHAPVPLSREEKGNQSGLQVSLVGTKRFRITGELERVGGDDSNNNGGGWTQARVRFLDSAVEEQQEEDYLLSATAAAAAANDTDRFSLARATRQAEQFTMPTSNNNGPSLIDQWIALARQHERRPGQVDQLLHDLGPIPETGPSERALWVGALINPLPGMGVAMEIRPQLLMARRIEERVLVALQGLQASIAHMDGTKPLF